MIQRMRLRCLERVAAYPSQFAMTADGVMRVTVGQSTSEAKGDPGRLTIRPPTSTTSGSTASLGAPVRTICVASRSSSANASAAVACSLTSVACRPLVGSPWDVRP